MQKKDQRKRLKQEEKKGVGKGGGGGGPNCSFYRTRQISTCHAFVITVGFEILDKFIIQMVKICSNFKQFSFWILSDYQTQLNF